MKILIYGSKGWIGSMFLNLIKNNNIIEEILEGTSRVDNYHDVNNELDCHKPTHVISFIGRTHGITNGINYNTIDYLEDKLVENIRDNLFSPFVLAQLCNQKNIHYTYLGTGCIFKYDNNHPYEEEINGFNEEDQPNFYGSSYSVVKGFADMMMHMYPNVLNLRIRMPIVDYEHPRNFITKIVKYEKICSNPNSLTILSDFYPIILDMIKNDTIGTFNLVNPGLMSHNEILEMYKEIIDPEFKWINFSIEEQDNVLKSKRSNNHLSTKKIENLYPELLDVKQSMRNCLMRMKKNLI